MRGLFLVFPLLTACGAAKPAESAAMKPRPALVLPPLPEAAPEEEETPTPTLRVTKLTPSPVKSKTVDHVKPEQDPDVVDYAPVDVKTRTYSLTGTPADDASASSGRATSAEASSTWSTDPNEPRPSALDPQARASYKNAYKIFQERRPREALDAFASFVLKYPDHPYVEQATYWRGECYVALGDTPHALEQFRGVVARFPGTPKAHEAEGRIATLAGKEGAAR